MADRAEFSDAAQVSIRYNQILGLFDRSPLATGICYQEGLTIRVVNPAFAQALGVARDALPGSGVLDHVTPTDGAAADRLREAVTRRTNTRHELAVHWAAGDRRCSGRLTVEHVDDALIGNRPMLAYLHVDHSVSGTGRVPDIDPVARAVLEHIAGGDTTAATARAVGLTVDGVNYHVGTLCRRLGVGNRTALVARAYVLGVLDVTTWPPRAVDT